MNFKKFVQYIKNDSFHAVNFKYNDIDCSFSGWWQLVVGSEVFELENKEQFFELKVFGGKAIEDVFDDIDVDCDDIELICIDLCTCYFVQLKFATDIDYCYLYKGNDIDIGDIVSVPFGQADKITEGKVVSIEMYGEDEIPYPLDKMKYIIGKTSRKKSYKTDVCEFDEYIDVRIKGTNIIGTISDKEWNNELKKYQYIVDWTDSDGDNHNTFGLLCEEIESII